MSSRIYIGHLSSRTRERDVEDTFGRYGRIARIHLKYGYAFVEYDDGRDAEDAVREMNRSNFDGERIIVEHARSGEGRRESRGRGRDDRGAPGEGKCFNCGKEGHWARDCPDEGGRDRCFNCGRSGHLARECKEKKGSRSRPYSRSERGSRRSSSRSRSHSRDKDSKKRSGSRSPPRRKSRKSGSRSPSPKGRTDNTNETGNNTTNGDKGNSPREEKTE